MKINSRRFHFVGSRHLSFRSCGGGLLALVWLALSVAQAQATTYALGAKALLVGSDAETNSVVLGVTPASGAWTAKANATWLHLSTANQNGKGSTNVIFSDDSNAGATRTGTLTIGGKTLTVTQAGSTYVAARPLVTVVRSSLFDPVNIATDGAGNVYIPASGADAIYKWTATKDAVTEPVCCFSSPHGVAVDGAGNVYVADTGSNAIKEWKAANGDLITLVSSNLNSPDGVAVDSLGNIFIADAGDNSVKKWTAADGKLDSLVSGLSGPQDVAMDAAGNVYIADTGRDAIIEWIAANSNVVTLVTGLNEPSSVAVDGAGNVYVAEPATNGFSGIQEWTAANGNVTTLVAPPPEGAQILSGVAVDGAGDVYIADLLAGSLDVLPNAFVDPTARSESQAAARYAWPVLLPVTAHFAGSSDQSWLKVNGITNGVVSVSLAANNGASRTGNITLLGQVIPVTQSAAAYSLGTNLLFEGFPAGSGSVVLTVDPQTAPWTATANAAWLQISPASQSGVGGTKVDFSFDANSGSPRSGTLTIGGQTLTVMQAGGPYYLGTNLLFEGAAAGSDSVVLTVNRQTNHWTATANAVWLHLSLANQSGTGSANVEFSFDANPGVARSGTLTIAGQTLTVSQAGASYSLGANVLMEGNTAGSGSVVLTVVPQIATWTATANASWLHLSAANQSGTGSTNVVFDFDSNPGPARSGTLTIAGQTLAVFQGGANFFLGASALLVGPSEASNSVVLGANSNFVPWTATANASWLHLSPANQSGAGSTNVIFSFDANPGATRTGTLTIAGQTLTVTQAGSTYVAAGSLVGVVNSVVITFPPPTGPFYHPQGPAVDGAGNLYFADYNQIGEWTAANNTVTMLATSGLSWAYGVAVDSEGNVYIADNGDNAIKKWTAGNSNMTTLVSSGLSSPSGVAVDGVGNVYIADTGNNAIEEWSAANSNVITLVSSGLSGPSDVALDAAGNIYIADTGNAVIKEWIAANSNVITVVSSDLSAPQGVAVDGAGDVLVADSVGGGDIGSLDQWTPVLGNLGVFWFQENFNPIGPFGIAVDAGNIYLSVEGGFQGGYILDLTADFADTAPRSESADAGTDAWVAVLPATAHFVTASTDQPWLTINGVTNGVVSFSFTANTNAASRTANIYFVSQVTPVTQFGLPTLGSLQLLGDGIFQFSFTNSPSTVFTVLSTTNLSLPLSDWTVVGVSTNVAPGTFQFTSQPTTNDTQRFYIIRSP
jgi:sugar lactone lactonase YvrE/heat shock protein HslJ